MEMDCVFIMSQAICNLNVSLALVLDDGIQEAEL